MSIKTNFELPRGGDQDEVIKQGQRLAQDLSKNFKSISKQLTAISNASTNKTLLDLGGILFSQSISGGAGTFVNNYTFTHNIGSLPSGFIIVDQTCSPFPSAAYMSIVRVSWTTTDITVRVSINILPSVSFAASFSILVLE